MMRIFNLGASGMGNGQQEIADKAFEFIVDKDFNSIEEFYDIEGELINRACKDLKWQAVPATGGLTANWDSENGKFETAEE